MPSHNYNVLNDSWIHSVFETASEKNINHISSNNSYNDINHKKHLFKENSDGSEGLESIIEKILNSVTLIRWKILNELISILIKLSIQLDQSLNETPS